jgi:hypothetical protein
LVKENHRAIQIGGILARSSCSPCCAATTSVTSDIFLVGFAITIFGIVFRDWWLRAAGGR